MNERSGSNLKAKLILLAGVFSCSMSSAFFRYMTAPSTIAATYRLGWTVLLLTPLIFSKRETRKELLSLKGKDLAFCGLSGLFLAMHFVVWFESLSNTSIASSTVLVNTEVAFAAFGYLIFFGKKIRKKEILAIGIAFLGSVVLALLAAFFSACYTLIGTRERSHMSTMVYTYVLYWGCFLSLLVFDAVSGVPMTGYEPINWIMSLCLAVFCTLLGHSVFSWSLKFLTPTYVSTVKLAGPVFASVSAILLFGEIPGLIQVAGAAVVLAGVYLYAKNS